MPDVHPGKVGTIGLTILGGGNPFIELDKDNDGFLFVVIHSGSLPLSKAEMKGIYSSCIRKKYA